MPSESPEQFAQIRHRITAALDAMPAFEEGADMKPHLLSENRWLMDNIPPEAMSTAELAAMNIALASAHARLLVAEGAVQSCAELRRPPLTIVH